MSEKLIDIEACIDGWDGEGFEETAKAARAELARLRRVEAAVRKADILDAAYIVGQWSHKGLNAKLLMELAEVLKETEKP